MPRTKAKKEPKKTQEKKSKSKSKPVKEKVPEPKKESEPETVSESVAEEKPKQKRHVPTRESVEGEFEELVSSIEEEITRLRDTPSKSKGVKFLRSVNKKLKTLRTHTLRITKQRKTSGRKNNTNSGFLKPVNISKDLASFTGWDNSEMRSRVDVTKYICNYIKENDLQNPADRRQIRVDDDPKLKKLLGYDSKKDKKPLTYYSLQTYLKGHFLPTEEKPKEVEKKKRK